jgi:DNA polymerase-3 subunit beta
MNLSILKENLKQGLFMVSHLAGKNVNLPILNNIMIDVKKDGVKLVTTNLEIGITNILRGKVDSEGSFTVDSKIFSDYINLLPNKKIDLVIEDGFLNISCENYKTKIKTDGVEDFPLIPEIERSNGYKVKIKEFKKSLSKVAFAVANSESRMELSGVLFTINKNKLTLAATDSYRLAEKELELSGVGSVEEERKIIIPSRTIQEVLRMLSGVEQSMGDSDDVEFFVSDNQVLFIINGTELISRLIEGQYPDYKQIIPSNGKTIAIASRSELVRAIKTSALFSKTGINDVNLDFPEGKNQIIISSASGNTGENITQLEADCRGVDNSTIINYQYLLDGLNNIDEDSVKIELIDGNTPCLVRPLNEKSYVYIIMPIKQ